MDKRIAELALQKVAKMNNVDVDCVVREIDKVIRAELWQESPDTYPTAVEVVAFLAEYLQEEGA